MTKKHMIPNLNRGLNMFFHEVQTGDSLFTISKRYGISIDEIRRVNGLVETNIVPGQALLIPLYTYIVQPGDTLFRNCQKIFLILRTTNKCQSCC